MALPTTSDVTDFVQSSNTTVRIGTAVVSCNRFGTVEKDAGRANNNCPAPAALVTKYHGRLGHSIVLT